VYFFGDPWHQFLRLLVQVPILSLCDFPPPHNELVTSSPKYAWLLPLDSNIRKRALFLLHATIAQTYRVVFKGCDINAFQNQQLYYFNPSLSNCRDQEFLKSL
jgi:hypothetical protein